MPPNVTMILKQRLKVKSVRFKVFQEIYRQHRVQWVSTDSTGSLNKWDEINVTSIQGVSVDESVATSTSSVSRITERAISHPPQAGSDPEHSMPKAAPKKAAAPSTPPASISKAPVAAPNSSLPSASFPIGGSEATLAVLYCGGPKREKPRQL